ncbi:MULTISPECIES: hypothetical protein [unclassified Microcoleus]|uniref:hypothetical protein n=1 Tax=unclassified Microcoleus TaxID=2642155 RepID=UPI001D52BDA1|nr:MULTISPECIES: hypothetical protein [unclassified Microcoleus]MCC3415432.1 hypothetical protein [Microcoleus sp. PH2017_02_FOX_O_A]MCC3519665.1 hypothetical protein [Microcoleus sp. PH2017_18_LLB_O_A]MCC3569137.1 hypothetical protein [Microcoleus sp. PH2017_31_RDM_U_A]MCC3575695.1 hypothetical protein [Microcoleus sp. PH2017_34_RAT_O_A]MCC3581425.1 hypothetical protein [Microcoleus sp. PH2017_32_RDM_D_A]
MTILLPAINRSDRINCRHRENSQVQQLTVETRFLFVSPKVILDLHDLRGSDAKSRSLLVQKRDRQPHLSHSVVCISRIRNKNRQAIVALLVATPQS